MGTKADRLRMLRGNWRSLPAVEDARVVLLLLALRDDEISIRDGAGFG
jgi:hypothetical protein